jgi:hypothetical protein
MKPRMLLTIFGVLMAQGCYKATFIDSPQAALGQHHDKWTHFFVFGLVNTAEINVVEFCPNAQAAKIRTNGNFWTGLVSGLTIGIYTPRKVNIWCEDMPAGEDRQAELLIDRTGAPVSVTGYFRGRSFVGQIQPEAPSANTKKVWRVEWEVPS